MILLCVYNDFRIRRCSVRFYLQLFVGGLMPYLRYLCLFTYSGVQHILCCVFVLFFFVLCTLCCQVLWIVHLWLAFRCSLTFILYIFRLSLNCIGFNGVNTIFSNMLCHVVPEVWRYQSTRIKPSITSVTDKL